MVDIDHFKKVNDSWGHLAGDQVLAAVAQVLAGQLRPYDIAGQFGGDEFAVLLPDATEATARQVAERMRASIANMNPMPGTTLQVTVSIGVAVGIPIGENPGTWSPSPMRPCTQPSKPAGTGSGQPHQPRGRAEAALAMRRRRLPRPD